MGIIWRFYFRYVIFVYSIYFLNGCLTIVLLYFIRDERVKLSPIFFLNVAHKLSVTIWGFARWGMTGMIAKGTWQEECEEMYG